MNDLSSGGEPAPQAIKVLLVEDSFANRDMLTRRLQRRGFTVCSAADGSTGVAMSVSEKPDVILMDVALGEMDGWQATRLIKADVRTSNIPIIALTAHALATDRKKSLWPYSKSTQKAPLSVCTAADDSGLKFTGLNFGTQDYLGLSSDPEIKEVAKAIIDEYGVHSAGSSALAGNTKYSLRLEQTISEFLHLDHTALYPTGWAAGYGVIKALVRKTHHVVMDGLSHACLQEGAYSATPNVHLHGHLNLDSVRRHLRRIRDKGATNGILVITESLFSMDSDTPDLRALQNLCKEYGATLLVDVAHDLGAM